MDSKDDGETSEVPRFKKGTVEEIFRQAWAEERRTTESVRTMIEKPPKVNEISLVLSAEYLRLFTLELIHRANQAAQSEEKPSLENDQTPEHLAGLIEVRHLQKAAPGVLLDF